MKTVRIITVALLILITAVASGCLKKSITDDQIEAGFKAYLDAPYEAPTDEIQGDMNRAVEGVPNNVRYKDYLTPEERAAVEDWTHYRNYLKIQLVEDTPHELWEKIGSKCVRAFAMSCRDASYLETQYICELRIVAEVEGETDNFLVGELKFSNRLERVTPDIYMPSRR